MMTYRVVKNAIATLLHNGSLERYTVIGRQLQTKSATEARNKMVQVYYTDGDLPKSSGSGRRDRNHDINIDIDLTVSAPAQGDLSALRSETATPQQKAACIAAIKDATQVADEMIDDLIEWVFAIMTDARNYDLGLPKATISSGWLGRIQKDTLLEAGGLVVKTANLKYSCRVTESIIGAIGNVPDTVIFDTEITTNETDTDPFIGVMVENDNT
jgi:hypothetical protein